ncbi:PucR family transcriptional regulator ligand-binding domain-containing protein [Herbiconiux sp.]|uniref:PucR family transcriptional regulator ligand-binding domain-containing protein n=1 Tax=Herbiconiux sp. TaxID=1871186 RepID=UPI0025BA8CA0|nr:PucR family transcriptional regulator ligand-binding domain-containing protein [Herbiconiux sp.]
MQSSGAVLLIEDLVSTANLGIKVLAGRDGLAREVLWAHSREIQLPEQWLGPHELLMTVGLCVPTDPIEQVEFIQKLDDAGLSGLMIGDHDVAPPVSIGDAR